MRWLSSASQKLAASNSGIRVQSWITGHTFSVLGGTWSTIKKSVTLLVKTVAFISITIAALSFLQRQDPLREIHLDHETKALSIRNNGFVPFGVTAKAFLFELNWNIDQYHVEIDRQKPIGAVYTRGTLVDSDVLYPLQTHVIKLADYKQFEVQKRGAVPDKKLYCIVVSVRNLLSNQSSTSVFLTSGDLFSASMFGLFSRNSAMGGSYELFKNMMVAEDQITRNCLRMYSKME